MKVELTLKELFDATCSYIWEAGRDTCSVEDLNELLRGIVHFDRASIRKAYADGYTCCITPGWDDDVNEIRITHNDELFLVLCGNEIQF